MKLLAWIKTKIALRMVLSQYCHECGARIEQVWSVSDNLWHEVLPDWDPRCIACFVRAAERKGIFLFWIAYRESKRDPQVELMDNLQRSIFKKALEGEKL